MASVPECVPHVSRLKMTFMIGGLAVIGPFSIDTYFPSFPAMAQHFGVTELQVQLTLSLYLAAFAGMNLFHGALSDSFGRRRVILISLALYTLSSFGCVMAPDFLWLIIFRILQGIASGAGMIISQAIIRDCYDGIEARHLLSEVILVSALGPAVAPILGGYLHTWFGWRGAFVFLMLLGGFLWSVVASGLQESLPLNKRQIFRPAALFRTYLMTFERPAFLLLCVAFASGAAGFLLYVATGADVVVHIFKLTETQFGWLFVPIVAGLATGTVVTKKFSKLKPSNLMKAGFGFMVFASALNLLINLIPHPRLFWLVLPLPFYTFGFSVVAPLLTMKTLDLYPQRTGMASSLQGFSQTILFSIIAGPLAPVVARSGIRHAFGMALCLGLSASAYVFCKFLRTETN